MASRSRVSICAVLFVLACPLRGYGDKLQFTTNPSGATVELDGVAIGTTPCEKNFPGGYFHKTKTSFGARLEHPLVARISLTGYATKELTLTEGPLNWLSLNGRSHGEYWRSEEHTSELQSPCNLVCRLLLEKKKKNIKMNTSYERYV